MKKDMIIGVVSGLAGGFLLGALVFTLVGSGKKTGVKGKSLIVNFETVKNLDDSYLAKVEDFGVALTDYNNAYDNIQKTMPPDQLAFYKQNEAAFKAEVMETLINQSVVVAEALQKGFLDSDENMNDFRGAVRTAIYQLYITKNAPTNQNIFTPSTPEIDQAYQQFGAQLRARGLNAQQSREYLVTQLAQQKQQVWMANFVQKIKEGYRIERNTSLIEQEGISTVPMAPPASSPAPAPAPAP